MKRQFWLLAAALLALLLIALLASGGDTVVGGSSVLSRRPGGWLGARLLLSESGVSSTLRQQPLDDAIEADVLLIGFPARRLFAPDELVALREFLGDGGTLIYGYSGRLLSFAEGQLRDTLGLDVTSVRDEPPLNPWDWYKWRQTEWILVPESDEVDELVLPVPEQMPTMPEGATVLYRTADGEPAVFEQAVGRGRLVVLPTAALINCQLANPGNAGLAVSLARSFPVPWEIDEYRHGLTAPGASEFRVPTLVTDLLVLHLALIYLLAVLALARRFGPAWRESLVTAGSTGSFLRALGSLHHRLGHHDDAERLLVTRADQLDPRLQIGSTIGGEEASGDLVRTAKRVAELQRGTGL